MTSFEVVNREAFRAAVAIAPGKVFASIRREFKRSGNKFRVKAVNALLSGPPGIYLPANKRGRSRREVRRVSKKNEAFRHVLVKTGGRRDIFLTAYTSTFLTYHEGKIRQRFLSTFKGEVPAIQRRVGKEATRIAQVVLDKELSRNVAAFTRGANFLRAT